VGRRLFGRGRPPLVPDPGPAGRARGRGWAEEGRFQGSIQPALQRVGGGASGHGTGVRGRRKRGSQRRERRPARRAYRCAAAVVEMAPMAYKVVGPPPIMLSRRRRVGPHAAPSQDSLSSSALRRAPSSSAACCISSSSSPPGSAFPAELACPPSIGPSYSTPGENSCPGSGSFSGRGAARRTFLLCSSLNVTLLHSACLPFVLYSVPAHSGANTRP
jgi:hypothetical protein